jgi:hypothetical protein
MADITSASTLAEVQAAYDDNASYAEDNSVTKARAFETAAMVLLRREPQQAGRNGTAFTLDKQSVREELARVRSWLSARNQANGSSGATSRHLSFENFRS